MNSWKYLKEGYNNSNNIDNIKREYRQCIKDHSWATSLGNYEVVDEKTINLYINGNKVMTMNIGNGMYKQVDDSKLLNKIIKEYEGENNRDGPYYFFNKKDTKYVRILIFKI